MLALQEIEAAVPDASKKDIGRAYKAVVTLLQKENKVPPDVCRPATRLCRCFIAPAKTCGRSAQIPAASARAMPVGELVAVESCSLSCKALSLLYKVLTTALPTSCPPTSVPVPCSWRQCRRLRCQTTCGASAVAWGCPMRTSRPAWTLQTRPAPGTAQGKPLSTHCLPTGTSMGFILLLGIAGAACVLPAWALLCLSASMVLIAVPWLEGYMLSEAHVVGGLLCDWSCNT